MAESIRPIWKDRIYGGDGVPTFDINDPHLPQLTIIAQEGTYHNSGRMNNLFSFNNLISMGNSRYICEGLTLNSTKITETITEKEADADTGEYQVIALRTTEKSDSIWTVTEELYDINEFGKNVVVQQRTMTLIKTDSGEWKGDVV